MSQSRVFNLVRDGVVVGNVMLAADFVEEDELHFDEIDMSTTEGSWLATLQVADGVTLQEITQPVAEGK